MTREQMIAGLQHRNKPDVYYLGVLVPADAEIAAQLQADGETIVRLTKERDNEVSEREACHNIWANFRKTLSAVIPGAPGWPMFQSAEAIVARIAELEAALQPFARFANRFGETARDDDWQITRNPSGTHNLTMGDVRRARPAMRPADGDAT